MRKMYVAILFYLQSDVKCSLGLSKSTGHVNTIDVAVVALAEDHAVEGPVEDDPHPHHVLLTLNLQVLDLSHVGWLGNLPRIAIAWARIEATHT